MSSTKSTPALVLLSRSLRLAASMLQASSSQAPLARTLPPQSASMLRMASPLHARSSMSGSLRLSKRLFSFSSSPGRGGGPTSSSSSSSSSASASSSSFSSSSFASSAPRPPPEGTLITSPSNPFVKYCAKLRTSPSERSEAGATLLAGSTIISEVCGGISGGGGGNGGGGGSRRSGSGSLLGPLAPRVLFLAPDAEAPSGIPRALLTLRAPAEVLARLAGLATATAAGGKSISLSAVAVVDLPREADFLSQNSNNSSSSSRPPLRRLLALDGVQDPGNVGTLARTALALGWDGLYCLPGTADPWGDKSTRAARGAAWRLPVRSRGAGWGELLEVARGSRLDFLVAEPREEEEGSGKSEGGEESRGVCLVLGSEGSGLSAEGRAALASFGSSSDSSSSGVSVSSVSIPMSGQMESLNVATAGAVLMFALSNGAGDFVRGLEKRG